MWHCNTDNALHMVPLSIAALGVIAELTATAYSDTWVFPSRAQVNKPHLTSMGHSLSRVHSNITIPNWTTHDFRTTFPAHAVQAIEDGGIGVPVHV